MEPTNKTIRQNNNLLFQSADAFAQLPVLPHELIKTIFSELSSNDFQDTSAVTKLWNAETIGYTKETADISLKSLINFLIEQLGTEVHANQIIALKALVNESTILESTHLQDVKIALMTTQEKILEILVDVDPVIFRCANQHPLFNNFIENLSIFKTIKSIINEGKLSSEQKDDALYDLPSKLAVNGLFNKALTVATTISDPCSRASSIEKTINTLSEKKQYNDLINIANSTYHLIPTFYNIAYVISEGIKYAGHEKALKLCSKISDLTLQKEVINLINKHHDNLDLINIFTYHGIIK